MNNNIFTKSDSIDYEYCALIVKVGKIEPIEGSDFLVKTRINNAYQVVVGKDDAKEGDIMVYCKLETQINKDFLSVNNQFELQQRMLNENHKEVEALIQEGKEDEAKKLVGYFNKHGRVRIVKLRGCASEGCLFNIDALEKWMPGINKIDFEEFFKPNEDGIIEPFIFDTINGKLFVNRYDTINIKAQSKRTKKEDKGVQKYDRLIPGQFAFHYDTSQLSDNLFRLRPDTHVDISVKIHGTSHIVGKLLVKKYHFPSEVRKLTLKKYERELRKINKMERRFYWQREVIDRRKDFLINKLNVPYDVEYGKIISSRRIILNRYNTNIKNKLFFDTGNNQKDLYTWFGDLLYPYLIDGMTVYSEIFGYVPGSSKMIQKDYDYSCKPGEAHIMPYRITFTDNNGNCTEWNPLEVQAWTNKLIENAEMKKFVVPMTTLYSGKLCNLYKDIEDGPDYGGEVYNRMSNDIDKFGMEKREPLCKKNVPREGIVIRIEDEKMPHIAYKLKTQAFKFRECKEYDSGTVEDMESVQTCK